jgi:hypothetical protein
MLLNARDKTGIIKVLKLRQKITRLSHSDIPVIKHRWEYHKSFQQWWKKMEHCGGKWIFFTYFSGLLQEARVWPHL